MDLQAIFIYCLCHEIIRSWNIKDDAQCHMNTAEVMTFVIISALHYQCNYRKTRLVMISHRYFSNILSYSRLVRRIHAIPTSIWTIAFHICKETLYPKSNQEYIVDSFPIAVCQNNKIFRCKLFHDKAFHGYNASKKAYFFGIKVHMIVDIHGIPIEFLFTPGSESDVNAFKRFECDLPQGSKIYADKAYNDYLYEDLLRDACEVQIIPKRKKNSRRMNEPFDDFLLSINRNKIETVFSSIVSLMPRCIRAVTAYGFYIKVFFFILGYTVKQLLPVT
jgi:DDE family transposase